MLSGEATSSFLVLSPFSKGVNSYRKELYSIEQIFSIKGTSLFRKDFIDHGGKQEVPKVGLVLKKNK